MTMVVIGYDRFNVIVRGFKGQKITPGITFLILIAIWAYSVGVCIPPFFGWGGYALGKKLRRQYSTFQLCTLLFLFCRGVICDLFL